MGAVLEELRRLQPREILAGALDRLEEAVAEPALGREKSWAERVGWALLEADEAMCLCTAADQGKAPDYASQRQRQIGLGFLDLARALRRYVQTFAQPSDYLQLLRGRANFEKPDDPVQEVITIRRRCEHFSLALRRHLKHQSSDWTGYEFRE